LQHVLKSSSGKTQLFGSAKPLAPEHTTAPDHDKHKTHHGAPHRIATSLPTPRKEYLYQVTNPKV
jgi:hypothetical protein